jgi:hypothetical protein
VYGENEPEKVDVNQTKKEPKLITETQRAHAEQLRKERFIYNNRIAKDKIANIIHSCMDCKSVFTTKKKNLGQHKLICVELHKNCPYCGTDCYIDSFYRTVHLLECAGGEPLPDSAFLVVDIAEGVELIKQQKCRIVYNREKWEVCYSFLDLLMASHFLKDPPTWRHPNQIMEICH